MTKPLPRQDRPPMRLVWVLLTASYVWSLTYTDWPAGLVFAVGAVLFGWRAVIGRPFRWQMRSQPPGPTTDEPH